MSSLYFCIHLLFSYVLFAPPTPTIEEYLKFGYEYENVHYAEESALAPQTPQTPQPRTYTQTLSWPTTYRGIEEGREFTGDHSGIDLTMPEGTPIYAAASGVVTSCGWREGGGGLVVAIDHGNGLVTRYAHLSRIIPSCGETVERGEVIGLSGQTNVGWPHLHFTVMVGGNTVDPLSFLGGWYWVETEGTGTVRGK